MQFIFYKHTVIATPVSLMYRCRDEGETLRFQAKHFVYCGHFRSTNLAEYRNAQHPYRLCPWENAGRPPVSAQVSRTALIVMVSLYNLAFLCLEQASSHTHATSTETRLVRPHPHYSQSKNQNFT